MGGHRMGLGEGEVGRKINGWFWGGGGEANYWDWGMES